MGTVIFLGWQSREDLANVLNQARVGMVVLHPTPSYVDSYPVKLFEYMASGLPVVVSDFPLWRQIVETANCGLLVSPLDPKIIAEAVEWLLTHPSEAETMGRNGQKAVNKLYNWQSESQVLIDFYNKILSNDL